MHDGRTQASEDENMIYHHSLLVTRTIDYVEIIILTGYSIFLHNKNRWIRSIFVDFATIFNILSDVLGKYIS